MPAGIVKTGKRMAVAPLHIADGGIADMGQQQRADDGLPQPFPQILTAGSLQGLFFYFHMAAVRDRQAPSVRVGAAVGKEFCQQVVEPARCGAGISKKFTHEVILPA